MIQSTKAQDLRDKIAQAYEEQDREILERLTNQIDEMQLALLATPLVLKRA